MPPSVAMNISFKPIYERAVERKGEQALADRLPSVEASSALATIPDDRFLAAMARCVFSAGFRWKVIEAKWPGFEDAFLGFDPISVAAFNEEAVEDLSADRRIVRNPQKIKATIANAQFITATQKEHGTYASFVANWPEDDIVGLWDYLAKHGSRLGGNTGPRCLRMVGKDTFQLSPDVTIALTEMGILTGKPTTKKSRAAAQAAFNAWREETDRPLAHLSMILACTVDRSAPFE